MDLSEHAITNPINRRAFLGKMAGGLGNIAFGSLFLNDMAKAATTGDASNMLPHFRRIAPKAKRVIFLFQSGGPSHVDLFDFKKALVDNHGKELPPSIRGDQRVTGMTSGQSSFPVVQPIAGGKLCGKNQTWISDLLPYTQTIADDICVVRSMHTEAINHDPAITFINTGSQQLGLPSMGAWVSYGLGSLNRNLPSYIVLISQGSGKNPGQPIFSRLWGSGFLPSQHQGVMLRAGADPVLYLDNPPGVDRAHRRTMLDSLESMNQSFAEELGDPETLARIHAYEMAYRMQVSVPDLTDLSGEPDHIFDLYGPETRRPGSYASNCLMARRLAERGVRFVQLFHRGWDQHIAMDAQLRKQCLDTDQASAALVKDLKQRGMLEDTLVIWGGEFGRTVYSQGKLGNPNSGRDHHGRCFSIWLAGAGIRGGMTWGETDDFCWNIVKDPVHIRDMNATILHQLGLDHNQFTVRFRGLDNKPTGVEPAHVVKGILESGGAKA